ncbi:MAG: hypothetical protein KBT18_02030 [Comamonas sp.]|nr:hypothetical protein [Candidatus Comamonas equi]
MSIVVFHLHNAEPDGQAPQWLPHCQAFSDKEMTQALAHCQALRADARNAHVCISSELRDMVGILGVSAVEDGRTPDGQPYEWSKAGRAGAPRRR